MNTLDAIYQEVLSSGALKASFTEAARDRDSLADWLRAQDCPATVDDVQAFVKAKASQSGALTDDELDGVAGGCSPSTELMTSDIDVDEEGHFINKCDGSILLPF